MAHGRSSNYVIDSSNRSSDPARIKSTSDKESPKERSAIALFSPSVYGVSVRIQSRGQLAKYLFARSTFEINSHGCLSVSVWKTSIWRIVRFRRMFRLSIINGSQCTKSVFIPPCGIFSDKLCDLYRIFFWSYILILCNFTEKSVQDTYVSRKRTTIYFILFCFFFSQRNYSEWVVKIALREEDFFDKNNGSRSEIYM